MFPRITQVRHLKDYRVEIGFSDGVVAKLDLRERVFGRSGVFEPLQSIDFFAKVQVDQEAGTLVWPNGVDFCPDVLYAEATGKSLSERRNELDVA